MRKALAMIFSLFGLMLMLPSAFAQKVNTEYYAWARPGKRPAIVDFDYVPNGHGSYKMFSDPTFGFERPQIGHFNIRGNALADIDTAMDGLFPLGSGKYSSSLSNYWWHNSVNQWSCAPFYDGWYQEGGVFVGYHCIYNAGLNLQGQRVYYEEYKLGPTNSGPVIARVTTHLQAGTDIIEYMQLVDGSNYIISTFTRLPKLIGAGS